MIRSWKKALAVLLMAVLVLSVAGCSKSSDDSKSSNAFNSSESSAAESSTEESPAEESSVEESSVEESSAEESSVEESSVEESPAEESSVEESSAEESPAEESSAEESSAEESSAEESSVEESSAEEAAAPAAGLAGGYKLNAITDSTDTENNVTEEDMALAEGMGLYCFMELKEDGSAVLNMFGDEISGSWDESSITMAGEKIDMTVEGDKLTLSQNEETMEFKKLSEEEFLELLAKAAEAASSEEEPAEEGSGSEESSEAVPEESKTVELDASGYKTEPEVLVSNDNASVTITGYSIDEFLGVQIEMECVNNTDKNVMFSLGDVVVNGYMIEPLWASEVAAGKTAKSNCSFTTDQLAKCGITSLDEVTGTLTCMDWDDWSAEPIIKESVAIYPTGKTHEESIAPAREDQAGDFAAVSQDDFKMIIVSAGEGTWGGYVLDCYLENNTDKRLMFSIDNVSVNGMMIDPFWAAELIQGTKKYSDINFYTSDLEENNIEKVEEIEFELTVRDEADYFGEPLFDETLVYKP